MSPLCVVLIVNPIATGSPVNMHASICDFSNDFPTGKTPRLEHGRYGKDLIIFIKESKRLDANNYYLVINRITSHSASVHDKLLIFVETLSSTTMIPSLFNAFIVSGHTVHKIIIVSPSLAWNNLTCTIHPSFRPSLANDEFVILHREVPVSWT